MLVLSTAHSAKGKEWDAVFLIWAADGWFPMARALNDDEELEEERRLMYVALTRARNHLAVLCPLNSYLALRSADYTIDQMSRFLDRGVREKMERMRRGWTAWIRARADPRAGAAAPARRLTTWCQRPTVAWHRFGAP